MYGSARIILCFFTSPPHQYSGPHNSFLSARGGAGSKGSAGCLGQHRWPQVATRSGTDGRNPVPRDDGNSLGHHCAGKVSERKVSCCLHRSFLAEVLTRGEMK